MPLCWGGGDRATAVSHQWGHRRGMSRLCGEAFVGPAPRGPPIPVTWPTQNPYPTDGAPMGPARHAMGSNRRVASATAADHLGLVGVCPPTPHKATPRMAQA